jgi:hypothetical protein
MSLDQYEMAVRVAVCCYHPKYMLHTPPAGTGAKMDKAFQVAVELAGLEIQLSAGYFAWLELTFHKARTKGWNCDSHEKGFRKVLAMLAFENVSGETISYVQIPKRVWSDFTLWTGLPHTKAKVTSYLLSHCLDDHKSLVRGLHMVLEDVAHEGYKVKRAKFFQRLSPSCGRMGRAPSRRRERRRQNEVSRHPWKLPCSRERGETYQELESGPSQEWRLGISLPGRGLW